MKAYKHLLGYLERYTLLNFKRLHVRFHRIKRPDVTPFLHTHPFHYLSIVLRGGYTESQTGKTIRHRRLSFILRRAQTAHRIVSVEPGTLTLFFAWKTQTAQWELQEAPSQHVTPDWVDYPKGVYSRQLYGRKVYSKFDRYWHRCADTCSAAEAETRASIDQSTTGNWVMGLSQNAEPSVTLSLA